MGNLYLTYPLINPLNSLLQDKPWRWTIECDKVFTDAKTALNSATGLVHYDSKLPLRLLQMHQHTEWELLFHMFPQVERNDPSHMPHKLSHLQREKEALSIVFGINRFH